MPDLFDLAHVAGWEPYDLYDLAHVAGWEPYTLHGLGHVSSVGSALYRSYATSRNGSLGSR